MIIKANHFEMLTFYITMETTMSKLMLVWLGKDKLTVFFTVQSISVAGPSAFAILQCMPHSSPSFLHLSENHIKSRILCHHKCLISNCNFFSDRN